MATGVACPAPFIQSFNNAGAFNTGGSILTQVGGINTATYQDVGLTTPLPNPIPINSRGEVSDSAGHSQQLFLTPNIVYVFTFFDKNGNQIDQAGYVNGVQISLTQTSIGTVLYPQTAAEAAVPVVPTNFWYPPGNVLRYGTNTNPGTTDMTVAIQAAINQSGQTGGIAAYVPGGLYALTAGLTLLSNSVIYGDGGASVLQWANASLNNMTGTGVTNCTVRDLKFNVTGSGATVLLAGILFTTNCLYCKVLRCEFTGLNSCGVWLQGSSSCIIADNYFHNFNPPSAALQQNSCDVLVTNDTSGTNLCNWNIVENNDCFAGANIWFGVAFQQFYTAAITPNLNLAKGNRIGTHAAYGILFYNVLTPFDAFNQAISNTIENIQGSVLSNNSGAGIYSANQGGCSFIGNIIRNCCVLTTTNSLAPAGIGINATATQAPFVIADNNIVNVQNFYGIEASGAGQGGTISGNTINLQTGTPSIGIYSNASSNLTITGNTVNILSSLAATVGININANGSTTSNYVISGNTVTGCSSRGISTGQVGGFTVNNITISGNTVTSNNTGCAPLGLVSAVGALITGNLFSSVTQIAATISASTQARLSGNVFISTGTQTLNFSGVCTGSYFDKTNYWQSSNTNGAGGYTQMANGATGFIVEAHGIASPTTGTWAVGDRIEQYTPVVGNPKGWRCTVSGTSGTWVAEGNL